MGKASTIAPIYSLLNCLSIVGVTRGRLYFLASFILQISDTKYNIIYCLHHNVNLPALSITNHNYDRNSALFKIPYNALCSHHWPPSIEILCVHGQCTQTLMNTLNSIHRLHATQVAHRLHATHEQLGLDRKLQCLFRNIKYTSHMPTSTIVYLGLLYVRELTQVNE